MFTSYDAPTDPYTSRTRQGVPGNGYSSDGRKMNKRAKSPEIDYGRLVEAMRYSRRVLEKFRRERTIAVKEYVGYHYAEGGAEHRVPMNLIARYVQVVARSLVPKTPRVMMTTKVKGQEPAVSAMQEWMNNRFGEMHFDELLRRWVIDSLFCMGVMKVALGTPADAAVNNYVSPAGVPFAEVVDVDDFVFDAGCKDMRQASFVGHRFRVPMEVAQGVDYYDSAAKKYLSAGMLTTPQQYNQEGDERISSVSRGDVGTTNRDFEEMVDLWEVYFPRTKRVVTMVSDQGGVPLAEVPTLRVQEWVGPPCGPFHFLSLLPVPGNPIPKAPIQDLIDLHEFVNSGYRKLVNQMARQKTVLPVRGGAVDDGKNVIQANDGDMIQAENADQIKEVSFGGPNPVNAQFTVHLSDVFNKLAGNLDLLSGSNPQSKTATQDKLLAENASAGVADMQDQTVAAIARVSDAIGWLWWYHPQEVMTTQKSLSGAPDIGITRRLYPAGGVTPQGQPAPLQRSGRYEELRLRIDPHSLTYRTPQQRLMFLSTLVKELMPLMPLLGQQGVQFDAQAYLKKIAEYADEPDVTTLFTVVEPTPPLDGPGAGGDSSRMPTQTSREYVRRSVGQDTQANRTAEFDNSMSEMGADTSDES